MKKQIACQNYIIYLVESVVQSAQEQLFDDKCDSFPHCFTHENMSSGGFSLDCK